MKIKKNEIWIYYIGDTSKLDSHKCGKWMYFFSEIDFVRDVCKRAVEDDIVVEAKHSNKEDGVACFYLNNDDLEGHKKIISFFLENNLIQKTKSGKFYNISFKLDAQTANKEYGEEFKANIKLDQFLNLQTGEWII